MLEEVHETPVGINLLLYAYDEAGPFHEKAKAWWEGLLSQSETVGLWPCVLFGFIRISTNARAFENPLSIDEAADIAKEWMHADCLRLLEFTAEDNEGAMCLLQQAGSGGNLTTDAQIAATALQGVEIQETSNEYEAYVESLKALAPDEMEQLLSTVRPLVEEIKAMGTATFSNVEVDPSYFGISPSYFPIAPAESTAAVWDFATSRIEPRNVRTTGSGKIGFSFTDPLFPKVSLWLPAAERIKFTVPNEAPVFLDSNGWTEAGPGIFKTVLNFQDRELDTIRLEGLDAAFGDLDYNPTTSELEYTLNEAAGSLISISTRSFTTDLPFTVLSSTDSSTNFEAVLAFEKESMDTISFNFKDPYNDPSQASVLLPLGQLVPATIGSEEFSIVANPATEGSNSPPHSEFLSYIFKSDYAISDNEVSQKFYLLEKTDAIDPAVDVWPLWFRVDLGSFHIPQIINVLPEEGDGIPPEIQSIKAGFTYEKDKYNVVLTAVDGESEIDAWYYRITDSPDTLFQDPQPGDSNWIPMAQAAREISTSLSLVKSHPFFVAPEGYDTDWYLHFWCRDAAGNVSQQFIYDLPVAKTYYTDPRDNKRYETIVIAGREWFRENLAYQKSGSRKNYNFSEISDVLPPGWNAPSVSDYTSLMSTLGMSLDPSAEDTWMPGTFLMDALNLEELPAGDASGLPWWTRGTYTGVVGWLLTSTPTESTQYPFYYFRFSDDYNQHGGEVRPEGDIGGQVQLGSGMTNITSMALRPWRPATN